MMTSVTVLAIWGIGSAVFTLSIAAVAAKTIAAQSPWACAKIHAARSTWERVTSAKTPQAEIPVYARQVRAQ